MGAAAVVGVVLGGCSSGDTNLATLPGSTASSSSPSASVSTSSGATTGTTSGTATGAVLEGANLVAVGVAAPPDAAQAEVFNAYVEFWQADMAALARSDPAWAPLLQRLSGQQKTDTVALLSANQGKGQTVTGTITIKPQVLAVTSDAARIRDCVDLSRTQVVDRSGQPVPGSKGKAGLEYSVSMARVASSWTVSNIDRVDGPGCA